MSPKSGRRFDWKRHDIFCVPAWAFHEHGNASGKPLDDAAVLSILQKMIKQRQESVELYKKGSRADLVKQEEEEIAIISGYLPKQMSDDEAKAAIAELVTEAGATSVKDMGAVMALVKARLAGQIDMGKASGLVKAALSA